MLTSAVFCLFQTTQCCKDCSLKLLSLLDCNGLKLYFEQQGGPYNVFDLNKVPNSTSNFKNVKQIQDQSQDQSCKVGKTDYIEDSNGKLITINSNYFTVDKQNKVIAYNVNKGIQQKLAVPY